MTLDMELAPEVPRGEAWIPKKSIAGRYYHDQAVWELEQEKVFARDWFLVSREEEVANVGDYVVREVGEDSLIIVRTKAGELRAYYNSCSHRGTRLCDGEGHLKSNVIVCPYHAWTYSAEGDLIGTPNVHEEEGFDKSKFPLHQARLDTWQGFVFVNMGGTASPLLEYIANEGPYGNPLSFERYHMDELRIGFSYTYEVEANWKIISENYNECLHCPQVHPELVQMVPIFRKGRVDERENYWGNLLANGACTLTPTGFSNREPLPGLDGEDLHAYYGFHLAPNLFFNFHSDCVMYYRVEPVSVSRTRIVSDFLFHPDAIARPDFDPTDIAEFWDVVSKQDWDVCERAQIGTKSRGYRDGGVYPWNDHYLAQFNEFYMQRMGE